MNRADIARGARSAARHPTDLRYCRECGILFNDIVAARKHQQEEHT